MPGIILLLLEASTLTLTAWCLARMWGYQSPARYAAAALVSELVADLALLLLLAPLMVAFTATVYTAPAG